VAWHFSLVKTRALASSQRDLQLNEFSRVQRALARLNRKLISTGKALLAGIDIGLRGEVVGKSVVFGHVVKDDKPVLGLTSSHLFEIYLLNREKDLGANLADSCSLSWYRLAGE
jgi:hypothetical protein